MANNMKCTEIVLIRLSAYPTKSESNSYFNELGEKTWSLHTEKLFRQARTASMKWNPSCLFSIRIGDLFFWQWCPFLFWKK